MSLQKKSLKYKFIQGGVIFCMLLFILALMLFLL